MLGHRRLEHVVGDLFRERLLGVRLEFVLDLAVQVGVGLALLVALVIQDVWHFLDHDFCTQSRRFLGVRRRLIGE